MRLVASFEPQSLYSRDQHPLSGRLGEGIVADLDDLPGIEQRYFGGPARRAATIAITQGLTESHIIAENGIQC
jgi:hypothetical protein